MTVPVAIVLVTVTMVLWKQWCAAMVMVVMVAEAVVMVVVARASVTVVEQRTHSPVWLWDDIHVEYVRAPLCCPCPSLPWLLPFHRLCR